MMKAQWIVLIVLGGVAVIGAAAFFVFGRKGPDLSSYLPLKEPRIARMDDERVLEVKFSGRADTVIQKAYGEVAEILHLGSYETETQTIDRLVKYIEARGYRIVGDHEEEYLKGPGMGKVDPKDYWTIIRYRVAKK